MFNTGAVKKKIPKPPASARPLDGAVLMTRTALKKGMVVGPKSVLNYAGQEYMGAELLAAIAEEDGVSGQTAVNTRRAKDCIPRLLCLIVSDAHRPAFLQTRLQCSRQELDNKETGKNRGVWTRLSADFRNQDVRVRAFNSAVD